MSVFQCHVSGALKHLDHGFILVRLDNASELLFFSVLKEEKIFEKIIAIKYDVPNDRLDMFDDYKKQIDDFYNSVIERNA